MNKIEKSGSLKIGEHNGFEFFVSKPNKNKFNERKAFWFSVRQKAKPRVWKLVTCLAYSTALDIKFEQK